MIKKFAEIKVWQKSHQLVLDIYKATDDFPKSEKFGLVSQMRRAAVSVPSNIAEGFKRKGARNSVNFYNIAEASLEELKYQSMLSKDLGYLKERTYVNLMETEEEVGKMLSGWKKSQGQLIDKS